MADIIRQIESEEMSKRKVARYRSGDTVRVHVRIKEGSKERIQVFEGVIIAYKDRGLQSSMTVRKVSYGVGVERVFPLYSPSIERVEWVRRGRVRRSKLYYLRNLRGKKARLVEVRDAVAPKAV